MFSAPRMHPLNIHALIRQVIAAEPCRNLVPINVSARVRPVFADIIGDADHLQAGVHNLIRNCGRSGYRTDGTRGRVDNPTAYAAGSFMNRPVLALVAQGDARVDEDDGLTAFAVKASGQQYSMFSKFKVGRP